MSQSIVTFFSAEGTTKQVAVRLAQAIGADLFEILPEKPYSAADINWKNPLSRCNREFFGKKDVPVVGKVENMAAYDTIYVGFPIWYGCAPIVVNMFLKDYDLSGKKIAVFATSGGSGLGKTAEKLQPFVEGAEIVKSKLFAPSVSTEELKAWAET